MLGKLKDMKTVLKNDLKHGEGHFSKRYIEFLVNNEGAEISIVYDEGWEGYNYKAKGFNILMRKEDFEWVKD